MKPQHQTLVDRAHGNCLAASVASILEIAIERVPNFGDREGDWWDVLGGWCLERGVGVYIGGPEVPVHNKALCVAVGPSRTFPGCMHAVVARRKPGGEVDLVFDPNPGGLGLGGPPKYFIYFIVIDAALFRAAA